MSWTEERVELLRKLWNGHFSASRIAAELGVTRNAVIGKIHRLGLWGRGKPSLSIKRQHKQEPPQRRVAVCRPRIFSTAALKARPENASVNMIRPLQAMVVPSAKKLTIVSLTERTCKWPIGDPHEHDFHFCGHDSLPGLSYCQYHTAVAYRRDRSVQPKLATG